MFAKRLSADDTSKVGVHEDNPCKFGSRLDRENSGSTLTFKITKDLLHFDRVSAYFSDASQNFHMHKIYWYPFE